MQYPISTLSQLGLILKGFRKQKGMTQADLAGQLNVSQQAIAKLEASPEKASVENLFRVLRLLDANLVLADAAPPQKPSMQVIGVKGIPRVRPAVRKVVARKVVAKKATVKAAAKPARKSAPAQKPPTQVIKPKGFDSLKMGKDVKIQAPRPVIKKREQW